MNEKGIHPRHLKLEILQDKPESILLERKKSHGLSAKRERGNNRKSASETERVRARQKECERDRTSASETERARQNERERDRTSASDRTRPWAWQIKGECLGNGLQTEGFERLFMSRDYAYGKRAVVSTVAPEPLGKEQGRGGASGQ